MPGMRIPVSAAAERSLGTVFEPFMAAAARARDAQGKFLAGAKASAKGAADAMASEADRAATAAAKAFAQIEAASTKAAAKEIANADKAAQAKVNADLKAFDQKIKAAERAAAAETKAANKAATDAAKAIAQVEAAETKAAAKAIADADRVALAKQRAAQREFDQRLREAKRAADAEEREIMRTAKAAERKELREYEAGQRRDVQAREQRAVEIGRDAYQTFAGVARAGVGVAGDVARGAGVNLDLSSYVSKAVSAETKAVNIVNQAAMSGQEMGAGAAPALITKARAIADAAKVDANATLDVLGAFQAKSSDLKTGEDVLERLAKLAKISGTSFEDMGTAAGSVNAQLDDTPDRAERLVAIMAHLTKQTADGSVEMSDYAKYVGVIAAQAKAYTGSFDKNIGQLGALSQMAMLGGAYSAAMATGAAASFNKDLTKDKTLKTWNEAGINVFADEGKTQLKDVEDIIIEYTRAKGADRAELAKFFPNVVSKRAVSNSLDVYQAAGGGAAGEAAIRAEFAKFRATLDSGTVDKLYKNQEGTTANKVQDFNNKLEAIAASMSERLFPALEAIAPRALQVAEALGKMIEFAGANPGAAIVAAITASIAKAAIGNAVSSAIENALKSAGASAGGKGMAFAIGAATIGITLGSIIVSEAQEGSRAGREKAKAQIDTNENVLSAAEKEFKEKGTLSPETLESLIAQKDIVKRQIQEGESAQGEGFFKRSALGSAYENYFGDKSYEEQGRGREARDRMGQLSSESKGIDALIAAVKENTAAVRGNKTVSVDNIPAAGAPGPSAPAGMNTAAPRL